MPDDDDDWPSPSAPPAPAAPMAAPTSPSDPPEMTIVSDAPSEIVDAMRAAYLNDQQQTPHPPPPAPPSSVSDYRAGDESIDPNAPTLMRQAPSEARAGLAAFADGGFPAPPPRPAAGDDESTLASALSPDAWQAQQAALANAPSPYAQPPQPPQPPQPQQQPAYYPQQAQYPQSPQYNPQPMAGAQGPWGGRMPFQAPPPPKGQDQRMLVLIAVGLGAGLIALLLIVAGGFLFMRARHR